MGFPIVLLQISEYVLSISNFTERNAPLFTTKLLFETIAETGKRTQDFCHLIQEQIDGMVRRIFLN